MNLNKRISLKKSRFNLEVYSFEKSIVVYNTLQDSLTLVKEAVFNGSMSITGIRQLHDQGVLVNTAIDETAVFRYRNSRQKFNGKRLHVFVTLTGSCNCHCQYCFAQDCYSDLTIKDEDIPCIYEFIVRQLKIHRSTMLNIDFFGGEPLLKESIYLKLMERLQKLCDQYAIKLVFQFYTNGTIEPKNGFHNIAERYNTTYLVTLDGPQEIHDKQRPMKNKESSFALTKSNLLKMKRDGAKAIIRINYGKYSYLYIPPLLDELAESGLTTFPIQFYPVQNMSESSAEYPDGVSAQDNQKIVAFLWEEAEKRKIHVYTRTKTANCYCSAFTDSMFVIDPGLNVYKCALLQCDKKYSIGNLKTDMTFQTNQTFYDWINYDPSVEPGCKDCVCLPICAGGCGGSGTFRYGTRHHSNCYDLSPAMIKMRMSRYVKKKYDDVIRSFHNDDREILILEKGRYPKL